ncbi:hypothetical protein T484DRAFT_1755079 [Baffinella frigidus]|nr:hypothetical protein T484DRAFT_1755079 [Cryptophyta sp. CCMP2293]
MERSAKKRKLPSYMTQTDVPAMRVVAADVLEMVYELYDMWMVLYDNEDCALRYFLKEEVALVVQATEIPFYTDDAEFSVYQKLRACAVEVERVIFVLMDGRDENTMRGAMPLWDVYEDIMDKVRELSVVQGTSEKCRETVDECY